MENAQLRHKTANLRRATAASKRYKIKGMMMNTEILNSWKEIAAYVGRGVRTVQRWERELNFPVRRPRGKERSAVIALKSDVDRWLRTSHGAQNQRDNHLAHPQDRTRLIHNTQLLVAQTSTLLAQSDTLRKQITRAITIGKAIRSMTARVERKDWTGVSMRRA